MDNDENTMPLPHAYQSPLECVGSWIVHYAERHGEQLRPTLGWLMQRSGLARSTVQKCRQQWEARQMQGATPGTEIGAHHCESAQNSR